MMRAKIESPEAANILRKLEKLNAQQKQLEGEIRRLEKKKRRLASEQNVWWHRFQNQQEDDARWRELRGMFGPGC